VPNLSDSCRINGVPASVRQLATDAQMPFPLSVRDFIADDRCPHTHCLTLHLKFLETPTVPMETMLMSMRTVYDTADIGVRVASRESLSGPAFTPLLDVDVVANCPTGSTTADQNQLFGNRSGAAATDLVIYLVRSTVPALNGCASHPNGQPGAVVAKIASAWTMAHETGHVLGLSHITGEKNAQQQCVTPDYTRLMTGCSTSRITGTPTVDSGEISTMQASSSTFACPR
jgi:hypothetical protein